MSRPEKQARDAVIGALGELLEELGLKHTTISDDLRPIGDLGLESIDGVDFACRLSEKLGVAVPQDANPFVDDAVVKARTVKQIVGFATELLGNTEVSSRG